MIENANVSDPMQRYAQRMQALAARDPVIDFIAAVRDLPIGPDVPHLTEQFIHKYLDDMYRLGLVDAVGLVSQQT